MPLIDLKTDLKSLKYGKDTLGGGYSGQPYIQTSIPDSFNDLGPREDFILRGGISAVTDSLTDIKRLGKMFIDTKSPNGLLFIAKQQLLSRTAVRTQTSGILNEGIYSPLNTLAQAGVSAFGGHLNKQGLNPFSQTGAYSNNINLYGVRVKPTQATSENRLAELHRAVSGSLSINNFNFSGINLNVGANVLTYTGGPDSPLGVGSTAIRFVDPIQRTGTQNAQAVSNPGYFYGQNQQRSVDSNNKQVGGLQVSTLNKPWIKGALYELPTVSINSPQSASLFNIPNGPITWTSNVIEGINYTSDGSDFLRYLPTFATPSGSTGPLNNKGVSGKYFGLVGGVFAEVYNAEGQLGSGYNYFNVYDPNTTPGNTWPDNTDLIHANNTWTYSQRDIISPYKTTPVGPEDPTTSPERQGSIASPKIQDFRAILRSKLGTDNQKIATDSGATALAPNYNINNIENRTNLGDPGQRSNKSYANYSSGVIDLSTNTSVYGGNSGLTDIPGLGTARLGLDKITSLPIYRSQGVTSDPIKNDLVKFRIAIIDNDNPSFKTFLHFRAFLGNMSDSYSANWSGFNYLGRGEQFFTYGGFTRQISLSWTVAAQSKQELIPMYKKLNYLASTLTPDYSSNGYMRGNLAQLTVGGYVYELPGIITSLTYDIAEDTPWEIGINSGGGEDGTVKELPHIIRVTGFNFIPIHNFLPRTQEINYGKDAIGFPEVYGNQRFISLANGLAMENSNYNALNTNANRTSPRRSSRRR
jgi:hypothetical protein